MSPDFQSVLVFALISACIILVVRKVVWKLMGKGNARNCKCGDCGPAPRNRKDSAGK